MVYLKSRTFAGGIHMMARKLNPYTTYSPTCSHFVSKNYY